MDIIDDDVASGGDQEVDTGREHERILKEIETTDTAFIGASLRAVYEGSDHDKFLQKLDLRIKQHDRDIERLCNFHYQGFIESITELIKVRGDAERLKNQVITINNEQQESGKELSRKCEDLIQCRLQQRNIASAIDELTMCLPVLQTYGKMQDQINAGRYYSALKTLEKLEHTYLPPVHKYRYCEIMIENIPKIREHIKEVSISELKDFLEVVRKNSPKIGKLAMCQVDQEKNFKLSEADDARTSKNFLLGQESLTEVDRHLIANGPKRMSKEKRKAPKKNPVDNNSRTNPFDKSYDDLNSSNPFGETNGIDLNPFDEDINNKTENNPFIEENDITNDQDQRKLLSEENIKDCHLDKEESTDDNSLGIQPSSIVTIRKKDEMNLHNLTEAENVTAGNASAEVIDCENNIIESSNPFSNEPEAIQNEMTTNIDTTTTSVPQSNENPLSSDKAPGPIAPPRRKKKKGKVEEGDMNVKSTQNSLPSILVHVESSNTKSEFLNEPHFESISMNDEAFERMDVMLDQQFPLSVSPIEANKRFIADETQSQLQKLWQTKPEDGFPIVLQDVSPSDLIDFSPVYKCLHIFGILKFRDQFEKYYRSQRRTQAVIALQPPNNMHESLEGYIAFFHQIVGFFVIEDHILHTANNLIDQVFIDSLWDMALSEIVAVLRTDSDYCGDADMLMAVKNNIVIFADTLKAYGFVVDQLFSLLIEMREQYSDILLKKWSAILQTIFDEDNYTPIQITSDTEEMELLSSFPYEDADFIKSSFPKQLPFSRFVPRVFNEIKSFVKACLEYCEDLHLSSTEVDDMIRKSTNLLLTRTLSTELQKLVQKPTLGLTELVQITINTSYLENSCKHVEEFVHSITGVDSSASHTAKLVGVSTFKDARSETESQIYVKVNSKVDEFFELAEYNWSMSEPLGTASSYLLDLIAYLRHNFRVFSHLPEKVAQTSCMSACKHIATRLMETLMDHDIRQITMAALQQYNLDVMQCELFSSSDPVPGFQEGVLQMSFLELRQLLDLFLSWDWSSYLADYGSGNSKYLRVSPATALSLLEKIREDSKRRNIFTSFNRQEREKKKLLETVLKQLRNIVNDWTLLCVPYNKLNKQKQDRLQY